DYYCCSYRTGRTWVF
nr:immunoglobulin light chain junction region [Macaca mulatta]